MKDKFNDIREFVVRKVMDGYIGRIDNGYVPQRDRIEGGDKVKKEGVYRSSHKDDKKDKSVVSGDRRKSR